MVDKKQNKSYSVQLNYNLTKLNVDDRMQETAGETKPDTYWDHSSVQRRCTCTQILV